MKGNFMTTAKIVGIILIVLGVIGFIAGGITYTEKETAIDMGPIEVQTEQEKTIPIPQILSGLAIVGGVALLIAGARKKDA
jgi:hypothetical protein